MTAKEKEYAELKLKFNRAMADILDSEAVSDEELMRWLAQSLNSMLNPSALEKKITEMRKSGGVLRSGDMR